MKISIITATFNRFETIRASIESSLSQDYVDFEIVVQDGGLDSETLEFFKELDDHRVKYVREPDCGLYDALNRAISRSSGDIICFMHSDDCFAHSSVLSSVSGFFCYNSPCGVYGNLVFRSSMTASVVRTWIAGSYEPRKLKFGWMPPHPALFLSRSVYDRFGLFDNNLKISADYDFFLRIASSGVHLHYIDDVLVDMALGGVSNGSLTKTILKWREDYIALKRNGFNPFVALPLKSISKITQYLNINRR